jgi:hypothetical protein
MSSGHTNLASALAGANIGASMESGEQRVKIRAKHTILPQAYVTNNTLRQQLQPIFMNYSNSQNQSDEDTNNSWTPLGGAMGGDFSNLTPWPAEPVQLSNKKKVQVITRYADSNVSPSFNNSAMAIK